MLGFDEFCDFVKENIREYMSEVFQKNNFEFRLDETKDNFEMVNALLYIVDKKNPNAIVPVLHLDVAYENYKQTGDINAIVVMLAGKYEAIYQEKMVVGENIRPEFEVLVSGEGITNAFIISNVNDDKVDLYQDDVLIEISSKEHSNLLLVPINDAVLLAVPVKGRAEYKDCMECLNIIKKESEEQTFGELQPKLYDKENNVILSATEEIDAMLQRMDQEQKSVKRSIFSKV